MQLQPVKSSNIKAVGYDPASLQLVVEFQNGSKYAYAGVSPEVHKQFVSAESVGKFLNSAIRGKFEVKKLEA